MPCTALNWHAWSTHLPVQPYGKLVTMIYLKVSLSDFLTLFSARTEVRVLMGIRLACKLLRPCTHAAYAL